MCRTLGSVEEFVTERKNDNAVSVTKSPNNEEAEALPVYRQVEQTKLAWFDCDLIFEDFTADSEEVKYHEDLLDDMYGSTTNPTQLEDTTNGCEIPHVNVNIFAGYQRLTHFEEDGGNIYFYGYTSDNPCCYYTSGESQYRHLYTYTARDSVSFDGPSATLSDGNDHWQSDLDYDIEILPNGMSFYVPALNSTYADEAIRMWNNVPLTDRIGHSFYRTLMPSFHSREGTSAEIREEFEKLLSYLTDESECHYIFGNVSGCCKERFKTMTAWYFSGVDVMFYFTRSSLKSARPFGIPGGVKCAGCGEDGHIKKFCPKAGRCHRCKQVGHLIKDCKKTKKNPPRTQNTRNAKKANLVVSALTQNLQELQGTVDAVKEQAKEEREKVDDKIAELVEATVKSALEKPTEMIARVSEIASEPEPGPKNFGISFRTGSHYYVNKNVHFLMTAVKILGFLKLAKYNVQKLFHYILSKLPFFKRFSKPPERPLIQDAPYNVDHYSIVKKFIGIKLGFVRPIYSNTVTRMGGFVHSVSDTTKVADLTDVRLDYLAVGELKHKDPLYASYVVHGCEVIKECSNIGEKGLLKSALSFFVPEDEVYVEKMTKTPIPVAFVSKEAFKNLASFRISPFNSDESAKNTIKIGLTKCATINHSKNFIEQNDVASGGSDEVLTRTYEALLAYREHLKEEQVLRHLSLDLLMKCPDGNRTGPVVVTEEFKAQALN